MELVFQEQQMQYLEQLFHETLTQEQTVELVVPDSEADINRVVDSFGTMLVREKTTAPGSASFTGGVKAGVLYVPEGETNPKLMEAYLPITVRKDLESITQECRVQWDCSVKEVDARMLNGRKVLLRVGVSCRVAAFAPSQLCLYDMEQPPKTLCLHRTNVPMTLTLDTGEKMVSINDEINLPEQSEPIDRVLKVLFRMEQGENKIVGNKALFKGTVHLHTLYRGADGSLYPFDGELPFSQYIELSQDWDEQEMQVQLALANAEVEPDGQMECRRLLVAINLVAQCVVLGKRNVCYLSDAYDLEQELDAQWQSTRVLGRLDSQQFRDTLTGTMPVPANRVLDVWAYAQDVMQQRNGEELNLQYGATCNVLYYDETGILQGKIVRLNQTQTITLASSASCKPMCSIESPVSCQGGAQPLLRCQMCLSADSFAQQELRAIVGGSLQPSRWSEERPSLILRRVQPEESLWSIAKSNRTTVQRLMEANELSTDVPPEGQMLLIPM